MPIVERAWPGKVGALYNCSASFHLIHSTKCTTLLADLILRSRAYNVTEAMKTASLNYNADEHMGFRKSEMRIRKIRIDFRKHLDPERVT